MATPDHPDDRQAENPYRAPAQQPAPESMPKLATGRIMIVAAYCVVSIGLFVGLLIVEQSRPGVFGHNRLPAIIMTIIVPGILLLVTVWQAFAERRRQQRRVPNP